MKNIKKVELLALLSDLKHEYKKTIGWSDLSEEYFDEIIRCIKTGEME